MKKVIKNALLMTLCLLVFGISSCSTPNKKTIPQESEKTANYWVNQCDEYYNAKKYEDAIEACKKAIEINPNSEVVHLLIGLTYHKFGMYKEAIDSIKQGIKLAPEVAEDANTHFLIGFAYYELGMYKEAIDSIKQGIEIEPDDARAHYNLGLAYQKLGKYQEAIDAYKQAIRIQPNNADTHYNIGVAYGQLGIDKESIEAYKQTIRINPKYFKAHYNIGFAYYRLGMYIDSIESFEHASETGYREAKNEIAWILSTCPDDDIRDGKRAIEIMQPLIADSGNKPYMIDTLAAAYAEVGNFSEAIKLMHEAIEKTDKNKEPELYKEIQLRLESYKNNKPWREKTIITYPR